MPRTTSLSLAMPSAASPVSSALTSPTASETTSASSPSAKRGDLRHDNKEIHPNQAHATRPPTLEPLSATDTPSSPNLTSLPPFPSSPKVNPRHMREQSKSFFSNLKASKSSNRVHYMEPTIRKVSEDPAEPDAESYDHSLYSVRKNTGSSPDLSSSALSTLSREGSESPLANVHTTLRRPVGPTVLSDSALVTTHVEPAAGRKAKPRFGHLLTRTRSMRVDDGGRRSKPTTPIRITGPEELRHYDGAVDSGGLRTAPLQQEKDRSFRDMMGSAIRNKSADRHPSNHNNQGTISVGRIDKDPVHGLTISTSAVFREGAGAHLISNLKNTSTKAADGLGKAGKGILGKISRSAAGNAKEGAEDEPYVCSTINLPLVEQTRRTRIARRLEDSKDKTEFWMPALPWRCIDYLNFRGCEEEGLYRIPGSGPRVREWQRRFDREGDINLFEEPDLYDINIIGSMFKAWLRDLPTEILPKATQAKISQECAGAKDVPKLLKDELSRLPPWNYYLLFAITCHLSLLHAYVDKNKMNYSNLCICFQPCLKIDSFCFQFLVCDWRNCWQGCWTEKQHLEEEYSVLDRMSRNGGNGTHSSGGDSSGGSTAVGDDRSLASSESSKATITGRTHERGRPPPLTLLTSSDPTLSTSRRHSNGHHYRNASQLPELAPVMPLSPIGL
ncbi:hypothetical protein MMC07_006965 [Pseudocyphellaria aurata]|nr:hypothetical protein [Pseudocyphellaria aurata]